MTFSMNRTVSLVSSASVAGTGWVPGMPRMGEKVQRDMVARQAIISRTINLVEAIAMAPMSAKSDSILAMLEGFFKVPGTDGNREHHILTLLRNALHKDYAKVSAFCATLEGAEENAAPSVETSGKGVQKARLDWSHRGERNGRGKELMRSGIVLDAKALQASGVVLNRRIVDGKASKL